MHTYLTDDGSCRCRTTATDRMSVCDCQQRSQIAERSVQRIALVLQAFQVETFAPTHSW